MGAAIAGNERWLSSSIDVSLENCVTVKQRPHKFICLMFLLIRHICIPMISPITEQHATTTVDISAREPRSIDIV